MNEAEVERLVVRLIGDASSLKKSMQEVTTASQNTANEVRRQASAIEGFSKTIQSSVGGALTALGALGAGAWLDKTLAAFQVQENAEIKLRAILRANGREVENLMEVYGREASALQERTTIGDEATLANYALAESYRVTGDAAIRAVNAAAAIAAINDGSAASYIRVTAAMEKGDVKTAMMYARMIPQLRGLRSESEFLARYQQLVNAGMMAATEIAKSDAGAMQRLKNAYGDLLEQFGKIVAEIRGPVLVVLKELMVLLQDMSPEVKQVIVVMTGVTVAVLSVVAAAKTAALVFGSMFAGFAPLLGILALTAAAVSLLISRLGGVTVVWEGIKDAALNAWNAIKPTLDILKGQLMALWQGAQGPIDTFAGYVRSAWESIKGWTVQAWDFMKPRIQAGIAVAIGAWIRLRDASIMVWDYIKAKAMQFYEWLRPTFEPIVRHIVTRWELMKATAFVVWDSIKRIVTGVWTAITNTFANSNIDGSAFTNLRDGAMWLLDVISDWQVRLAEFIVWARPMLSAAIGAWVAGFEMMLYVWDKVWEGISIVADFAIEAITEGVGEFFSFVSDVWREILGDSEITWEKVKEFITNAFLGAEFVLRNFGAVASYVWTGVQLGAVATWNDISYFFTDTMPALLAWFGRNWQSVFRTAWSFVSNVFMNLHSNAFRVLSRMGGALRAFLRNPAGGLQIDTTNLWTPLLTGFENTMEALPRIAPRQMGEVERQLLIQFQQQGNALAESWREFRARRLREIEDVSGVDLSSGLLPTRNDLETARQGGEQLGEQMSDGISQELQRVDAAARFTAESLRRIDTYLERIRGEGPSTVQGGPSQARFGVGTVDTVQQQRLRLFGPRGFAQGGPVYAATGMGPFQPRGTDTIPAMLTRGEYVINASSTSANLDLIRMINDARGPVDYMELVRMILQRSNQTAVYRSTGGMVGSASTSSASSSEVRVRVVDSARRSEDRWQSEVLKTLVRIAKSSENSEDRLVIEEVSF